VLALCFAEVPETYHIWRVFAGDSNGVCIEFDKDMLLGYFDIGGVRRGYVEYLTLGRLKKNESRDLNQLPFMKRHAFRDEKEFRFIYESKEEAISAKGVPIKLNCIQRIIFNPWIHQSIFNSVKSVIEGIDGCDKITIDKTSLVDNEQWKALGREISNSADATE